MPHKRSLTTYYKSRNIQVVRDLTFTVDTRSHRQTHIRGINAGFMRQILEDILTCLWCTDRAIVMDKTSMEVPSIHKQGLTSAACGSYCRSITTRETYHHVQSTPTHSFSRGRHSAHTLKMILWLPPPSWCKTNETVPPSRSWVAGSWGWGLGVGERRGTTQSPSQLNAHATCTQGKMQRRRHTSEHRIFHALGFA